MSTKNALAKGEIFYGLHMVPGTAEYQEPSPHKIFINEKTIREMNPTFAGRPVYVQHVDGVEEIGKGNEDGYVVESFFNKSDGKTWAKFIITTERGLSAIAQGWKLSNAYIMKNRSGGGVWNGMEYQAEVTSGEYEHLAIVPNPRYAESIILTPAQFKAYNLEKESELLRLANSKEGKKSMFDFFKKSKAENSADLESLSVMLPQTKKEFTVAHIINEYDEMMSGCYGMGYANMEHKVKVGDEEMTVNDLVSRYSEMKNKFGGDMADKDAEKDPEAERSENDEDEEAKKKALELAAHEEKEIAEKKKNELEEAKKKAEEEKANFEKLKNAPNTFESHLTSSHYETSDDKLARGKARYGK